MLVVARLGSEVTNALRVLGFGSGRIHTGVRLRAGDIFSLVVRLLERAWGDLSVWSDSRPCASFIALNVPFFQHPCLRKDMAVYLFGSASHRHVPPFSSFFVGSTLTTGPNCRTW